ncbi:hypothetical protein [Rhodohalobacter mucosus]|uniref:Uncharacterized protein n=1 Tax=Rhodohalobacter mucosus TaxID=2079485 RepID=A0A316TTS1_9BACT|nr:hypothetical protein [Rhodohalobacter mucosus]PWN07031.1 hypothetical protein DDZ15_07110 [Rhodohalobacter mucosus]
MKQALIGSFAGIAILFALDSFVRVIVAVYSGTDILMFSYSEYGGLMWPVMLTIFAGLTSFLGAMFALTYGRSHKGLTGSVYVLMLIAVRYGQIHLLLPTESLFYPITALILSLGGAFFAWQLLKDKPSAGTVTGQGSAADASGSKPHYHAPESDSSGPDTGSSPDIDR